MDPVAWDLAERVAVRVAGREPFADSYHHDSLVPDFAELTAEAEDLVAEETGLRSLAGPARARVTDRAGWVRANLTAFRRMLLPVTEKLASRLDEEALSAKVTRSVAGVEIGTLLGWMSTRVLGQYDLLIVEEEGDADQDFVYYVGPNVLAIEKRYGFPPREFRLWLAIHEVTHRAQFTGVPWLRPHFLGLVHQTLDSVEPDPRRLLEGIRRAVSEVRAGRNPLDEGGLVALFATDEQLAVIQQIGGMMSLLEGHGDVTMDRAARHRIPSAPRFSRVLKHRRASGSPGAKLVQQLIGLEAKLNQYAQGEAFIAAVEAAGGRALLDTAWEGPDRLPSLAEIRDPRQWIERVGERAA
ncbi:MAG TPA: zinc-dependent metalloprotease [Acidimicrobiales bacterium]|nr:zinc-dependent metalloprotease [Acidimicrobiales bacterium]